VVVVVVLFLMKRKILNPRKGIFGEPNTLNGSPSDKSIHHFLKNPFASQKLITQLAK
jgi:hypothetical protein